jgi:hypothetical protein
MAGIKNERRFAEAFAHYDPHEPGWFLGLDESSSVLDLRGVDFIAWVKYPKRRAPMPVPVQIKSSENGKDFYYKKHPRAKDAGVIVLVLNKRDTQGGIRARLFAELAKVREKGIVYAEYVEELRVRRVTPNGHLLINLIEERRAARERAAHAREAHSPLRFLPVPLGVWERVQVWSRQFFKKLRLIGRRKTGQKTGDTFGEPPMASSPPH